MLRVLTAVFGVLLVLSGGVTVPVSRVQAGRDSSAIVWMEPRGAEEAKTSERSPVAPQRTSGRIEYRSRTVSHRPDFDLFQRPPPHMA
jgi:hypothetical protein